MTNFRTVTLLFVAALVLAACDNEPPRRAKSDSKPQAETPAASTPAPPNDDVHSGLVPPTDDVHGAAANQDGRVTAAGLSFPIPEGWAQVEPGNSMRLAQVESGTCVAAFSTAGGGIDMNIDRWVGQFQSPDGAEIVSERETRTVNGLQVHLVEMSGTYVGMGMNDPQPETMMRAAIYETPAGLLFIKMTGPVSEMAEIEGGWNTMIDGATAG